MKDKVSATELARNLASIIDYVRFNRTFVTIKKGKQEIARLGPVEKQGFPLAKLGKLFESIPSLSTEESKQFKSNIRAIRDRAAIEKDPWAS